MATERIIMAEAPQGVITQTKIESSPSGEQVPGYRGSDQIIMPGASKVEQVRPDRVPQLHAGGAGGPDVNGVRLPGGTTITDIDINDPGIQALLNEEFSTDVAGGSGPGGPDGGGGRGNGGGGGGGPEGPQPPESSRGSETELNPEGKSPDEIVDIMLAIDSMRAEKREIYDAQFRRAADILKTDSVKSKLLGLEWQVSHLQRKRQRYDQVFINTVINRTEQANPGHGQEQGRMLFNLLSQLDAAEFSLSRYQVTLGTHKYDDLYLKDELEEFESKKQGYEEAKDRLRQQIANLVQDPHFFTNRDKHNQAIENKITKVVNSKKLEKQEEDGKRSVEQDRDEIDLERRLLLGEHPGDVLHEATFEQQMAAGAEEGLSWYFHEAREKGLFRDLDDLLRKQYIQWFDSMTSQRDFSQPDLAVLSGRSSGPKSYAEIETEIIAYFQALLPSQEVPSKPDNVEHSDRWNKLVRRGILSSAERQSFSGIRAEYMRRAQAQIMDALEGLEIQRQNLEIRRQNQIRIAQGLPGLPYLHEFPLPRTISGEWNVHILQREMQDRARKRELASQAEPLYERESYYKINLKGKNRQEIETGADQAAEDIMKSFNDFDFDAIKIRIQTLSEAIQGRRELIRVTEGNISEDEAQGIVNGIKDRVENKVNFHLMEWAGQNLQMGLFVSLLARYVQSRGVERIKEFPAMLEAKVGIAVWLFLSRKYRLHHRPQGWKGQLRDDDTAHKFLRGKIQDKIAAELMEYELEGEESRSQLAKARGWDDFIKNFQHKGFIPRSNSYISYQEYIQLQDSSTLLSVPDPRHPGRFKSYKILTPEKYEEIKQHLTTAQVSAYTSDYYEYLKDQIKQKGDNVTVDDLDDLRVAREARVSAYIDFQNAQDRASQAVTIANQIMDIFGESAELGDPSIIMRESGDFISVRELTLAMKFAIIEAGVTEVTINNQRYKVKDNLANIRERRKTWLRKAASAGYDRSKVDEADNMVTISLPNGQTAKVRLAKGFEETGLTQHQFDKLKEAWSLMNQKGFCAVINGVKFQDIIRKQELRPLKNNFLIDFKSSMSQINDPVVRDEVARGNLPAIKNILVRLGFEDRQTLDGTTQQKIDQYTLLVEDSRSFESMIERLICYMGTHPAIDKLPDNGYPPFNPDAIDFGFQNLNWGVKRLRHLRHFWYTNLNRTVPRGVNLVDMYPTLDRLAGEMDFENILDLAFNVTTSANGMESVDNPSLIQYANRIDNLIYLRGKSEGSVGKSEGGLDKDWGSFEKWLVDANGLWKGIVAGTGQFAWEKVLELIRNPIAISESESEKLVDAIQSSLGRFKPLLTANEASLGENRQALSAGAGYEDNDYMIFRFSEWMLLGQEGSGREQGGLVVQKEIKDIIKMLMTPGTFAPGRKYTETVKNGEIERIALQEGPSIWEEAMRKLTPSHNPRLAARPLTYTLERL